LWIAYPVGVLAAWTIVSSNDVWGANQEPYRFWLDTFVIVCMTILPVAVIVVRSLLAGPSAEVVEAPDKGATAGVVSESTAAGGRPRRRRVVVLSVLVLCVVVGAVSTGDYVNFLRDPRYQGLWNYNNPRDKAIAAVAAENRPARGDMFVSDPCIDALEFKLVSGQPEAFYNAGMAWPKNEPAVQQVMMDRGNGLLIAAHAQSAGVTRVITDSACTTANWPMQYGSELTLLGTRHYDLNGVRQSISVWKIG
jgi:hypothetical protein